MCPSTVGTRTTDDAGPSRPFPSAPTSGGLGIPGSQVSRGFFCAFVIFEKGGLVAQVKRVGEYIRQTCLVGPVKGYQGAGFLAGLIMKRPAKEIHKALLERNILTGTSGDPAVVRLLPPFVLTEAHVDLLRDALLDIGG